MASSEISGESPLSLHSMSRLSPDTDAPALGDVNSTSARVKERSEASAASVLNIILTVLEASVGGKL